MAIGRPIPVLMLTDEELDALERWADSAKQPKPGAPFMLRRATDRPFNWHGELIRAIWRHPRVKSVLLHSLLP